MTDKPLIFLIAGETSGDLLGGRLMSALKEKTGGFVQFAGIGGPRMQAQEIDLLFPQAELAHFGLFELIRHIPHILRRIKQTVAEIERVKPAALVTIDAPDFSFRVARQLVGRGIPLIHYVAPTVWVWRPGRAKKIAQFLTHLLALLPFEPPYFTRENLPCTFVGHSIVESGADKGDATRFRSKFNIPADTLLLTVLPGSRMSEVSRLLPIYAQGLALLKTHYPDLRVLVPVAPGVASYVTQQLASWPVPVITVDNDADKYDGFAASRAALACSGTVAVELAMAHLPSITVYKVNGLTAFLYRPFLKAKYANLVNIMQDKMVIPELLQENCTPDKIATELHALLSDEPKRRTQISGLTHVAHWLGQGEFVPSRRAAETVLEIIGKGTKP